MSRHASPTDEMPQTITVRLLGANGETTGIGTLDTRTGEFSTDLQRHCQLLAGSKIPGYDDEYGYKIYGHSALIL